MQKITETTTSPVLLDSTYKLVVSNGIGKPLVFNKDNFCTALKIVGYSGKTALWTFVILTIGGAILALKGIPYEDIIVLLSNIQFRSN